MKRLVPSLCAFAALLLPACDTTGFDAQKLAPPGRTTIETFFQRFGTNWAIGTTPDGRFVLSITGTPSSTAFVSRTGRELVVPLLVLAGTHPAVTTDTVPVVAQIGAVRRHTFVQRLGGEAIENAAVIVQWSERGGPLDIVVNTVEKLPRVIDAKDAEWARDVVRQRVDAELAGPPPNLEVILPAPPRELARSWPRDEATGRFVYDVEVGLPTELHLLAFERRARCVYEVPVRVRVATPDGWRDVMLREYSVDISGEPDADPVVRIKNFIQPSVTGKAAVFDPNPVNSLHPAKVTDPLPFENPPYLLDAPLRDLNNPVADTYVLSGLHVSIAEVLGPKTGPPSLQGTADFTVEREKNAAQLAAATAYYQIDTMARWISSLGFADLVRPALAVDVNGEATSDPKAEFIEATRNDGPYIWFSFNDKDAVFVAEDGDVVAHEYAHAFLQARTSGRFVLDRPERGKNESRAINEGFADYWSLSTFSQQTAKSQHPLTCYGEWARHGQCIREYPFKKHSKFDKDLADHENGQIWSGTLLDIFLHTGPKRAVADAIIIEGQITRAFIGDAPTMKEMAEGIIIAYGRTATAAETRAVCGIFKKHEIWPLVCCGNDGAACLSRWIPPP